MTRSCLLNRQAHEIVEFEFRGLAYTVGVGRFADGSLVEAFLNRSNDGLPLAADARDAAVGVSKQGALALLPRRNS
jgi:hypothetical protein